MINRELIRIKVVQLTYAYYQNGNKQMDSAEAELQYSLTRAYDLYNYLLSLIVAVTREERRRVEVATQRALREGADTPSQKFAYNRFAVQLEENKMLQDFLTNPQKSSWRDSLETSSPQRGDTQGTGFAAWEDSVNDLVRSLCNRIESSQVYAEYMADTEESYDADRELWRKLYRLFIQENEDIEALLEDMGVYWNDDKFVVDTFVLKTIKRFDPDNEAKQELLPEYKDREDEEFAKRLFRATIINADQYQRYMRETSRNWEFSRLAYMDVVIMQIAIAEMLTFSNIPVSVTINEYVELAKLYSTPKSGSYINGMLDSIARYLISTGKMLKTIEDIPMRRTGAKRQGTPRLNRANQTMESREMMRSRYAEQQQDDDTSMPEDDAVE